MMVEEQAGGCTGVSTGRGAVRWVVPLLIVLAALAAFAPSLQNGFVNLDDTTNLVANEHYRGFGAAQLRWMWTTRLGGVWQPASWMFAAVQAVVFAPTAGVFHAVSLAVHIGNCLLVYALTARLLRAAVPLAGRTAGTGYRLGAATTALVFGVHPLRAEVVAWASCQPYVLAGAFALLCVLSYLRAAGANGRAAGSRGWYALSLAFAALAMLSKAATVTLPVALVVLDVYPLRRMGWLAGPLAPSRRQVWLEKIPFFALSVGVSFAAMWATRWAPAPATSAEQGLAARIGLVTFGLASPLLKSFWASGLFALYEVPRQIEPLEARFVLSGLFVLGATGLLLAVRCRWPGGLAAWVCYLAFLAPVARMIEHGASVSADRYSYLACLAPSVLLGGGVLRLWQRISLARGPWSILGPVVTCLIAGVVALAALASRQVRFWHDSKTLWKRGLALRPDSAIAHNSLGRYLQDESDLSGAVREYRAALQTDPEHANAHANLSDALRLEGRAEEAIPHGLEAVRLLPDVAAAHYNLSLAYLAAGRFAEAEASARRAARLDPKMAIAFELVGTALLRQGKVQEAIDEYRQSVRVDPNYAGVYRSLGAALAIAGQEEEAAAAWGEAIRLDPDDLYSHFYLGRLLAGQGRRQEAIRHLREALRIDPDFRGAREGLRALSGE